MWLLLYDRFVVLLLVCSFVGVMRTAVLVRTYTIPFIPTVQKYHCPNHASNNFFLVTTPHTTTTSIKALRIAATTTICSSRRGTHDNQEQQDAVVTDISFTSDSNNITQPSHKNTSVLLSSLPLTSVLLRISYDGRHFTGWSSSNDDYHHPSSQPSQDDDAVITTKTQVVTASNETNLWKRPKRRSRRYRHLPLDRSPGDNHGSRNSISSSGYVRSVQGVLQQQLAKVYGNVPISSIIVEGCSRTDKGVHATGMIAQIYCVSATPSTSTTITTANATINSTTTTTTMDITSSLSIPGKRVPHPRNGTDSSPCFKPIPTTVPNLIKSLNRMLYPDVQIMAYAHVPTIPDSSIPFHPTLSAHRKTYTYTFSIGPMYDPTQYRTVWYIGPNHTCPMMDDMRMASHCLVGVHDFNAFTGATRSKSDRIQRQSDHYNTTCTIESIHISKRTHDVWTNQNTISTYTVEIIGDRFLYKMIRFMMGAMIAVGKGQLSIHDINSMLETGQRSRKEFECAPAHPLILQNVQYNVPIQWQSV